MTLVHGFTWPKNPDISNFIFPLAIKNQNNTEGVESYSLEALSTGRGAK